MTFNHLVAAFALCGLGLAIPSSQPRETSPAENEFFAGGWTPMPTGRPELVRRQSGPEQTCAYLSGDPEAPISCPGTEACGYNTKIGWWGCCESAFYSQSSWYVTDCLVATSCVDYTKLSNCDSSCADDPYVLKCTDTTAPYCAAGVLLEATTMVHLGCLPTPTVLGFMLTPLNNGPASTPLVISTPSPLPLPKTSSPLVPVSPLPKPSPSPAEPSPVPHAGGTTSSPVSPNQSKPVGGTTTIRSVNTGASSATGQQNTATGAAAAAFPTAAGVQHFVGGVLGLGAAVAWLL